MKQKIKITVIVDCIDCGGPGNESRLTRMEMELAADKWTGKLHLDALKAVVDKHMRERGHK